MEEEAIRQIGERLKGLREVLEISVDEVAAVCGITPEAYLQMEEGKGELQVNNLHKIARKYEVSLDELMFGEEPYMRSYFLTRKGKGLSVERRKAYKYESLASGFRGRKADPFVVQVEPKPDNTPLDMNSHPNQEFNAVIEGCMELTIGQRVLVLNEGDTIYFDASHPHCMRALNNKPVKFLAIII
jgi:transcriptional regulator with XRE-family HTH domain